MFAVPVLTVIQTYDVSGFTDLKEHALSLKAESELRTFTYLHVAFRFSVIFKMFNRRLKFSASL